MVITESIKQRFFDKIYSQSVGCWLWSASKNHYGYGQISINSRPVTAHRLSYEIHVGPILNGLHVCHKCDNPACVNPDHLFLGTPKDNAQDKSNKGRAFNPNKFKTHCAQGHEFTAENTLPRKHGRGCRACYNKWSMDQYNKRKLKRGLPNV